MLGIGAIRGRHLFVIDLLVVALAIFGAMAAWLFLETRSVLATATAHALVNIGVFVLVRAGLRASMAKDTLRTT